MMSNTDPTKKRGEPKCSGALSKPFHSFDKLKHFIFKKELKCVFSAPTLKTKKTYERLETSSRYDTVIYWVWMQWPNAIEHLVIPSTEGQIVWSIVSTPIK
jgi:hypothetical protein